MPGGNSGFIPLRLPRVSGGIVGLEELAGFAVTPPLNPEVVGALQCRDIPSLPESPQLTAGDLRYAGIYHASGRDPPL
jgi:hypothetical protein